MHCKLQLQPLPCDSWPRHRVFYGPLSAAFPSEQPEPSRYPQWGIYRSMLSCEEVCRLIRRNSRLSRVVVFRSSAFPWKVSFPADCTLQKTE